MKKLVTLILLVSGITILNAQQLFKDTEGEPFPEFECPENSVYCFTDYIDLELGPADDFFGQGFELATRFSAGSFSQIRFWGIFYSGMILKTGTPPVADFRVNVYDIGDDGPGDLKASFTFENKEADQVLLSEETDEGSAFFCMYDLNLPEAVLVEGEGFISITRINNYQERKIDADEPFIFLSVGDFDEEYDYSGESFTINGNINYVKEAENQFGQLLSINNKDADGWEAAPFKPFFALHNPAPVPIGSSAVYIGMLLIAGFTVFFLGSKLF